MPLTTPESEPWSPRRVVRTCVAGLTDSRSFGPLVAAEAQSRNVDAAGRRAFVADGAAYNWAIHRGYFPDVEPIADPLHVACYLFGAAQAVGAEGDQWPLCVRWLRAVWQGRVTEVAEQLDAWAAAAEGAPPAAADPRNHCAR